MGRLKVWVVTPELHRRGGTERCLAEQMERWKERFDLRLYTMRAYGVDLEGVAVRRILWLPGPHLFRYLWWFAANTLVRAWDARRLGAPDVVYSPGINCLDAEVMSVHIVFAKYWDSLRAKVFEAWWHPRHLHRIVYWTLLRLLERYIYGGPATVAALSSQDARALEARYRRPPRSIIATPNGVDPAVFSPAERNRRRHAVRRRLGVEGHRVILLVGNDAYNKGVDIAIRSVGTLAPDVLLAVAGRADADLIAGWAQDRDVKARVVAWPHTPQVMDYYAAADVVLAPSRGEASPLPPLEAMACGLPVVLSSRAGAVAELVEDGRHALVLRNVEDPKALARLVSQILDDPGLANSLAREGRTFAEQFTWDLQAEQTAAFIEREARTPRILVLTPHAWGTGGIERTTRMLLRALADFYGPERVGLLSVWGGSAQLPCRVLWAGPRAGGADAVPARIKMRFAAAAAMAARGWRRRLVIVACHPHLAPVAQACAQVSGAPFVVWCYGREVWGPQRRLVKRALRAADAVIAPSHFTASLVQQTAGIDGRRLVVLPLALPGEVPIDVGVRRQTRSRPRVLSVARLHPEHAYKGIDTLLTVWPRVQESVPQAELQIVGDGPDRSRLEAEARRLGLDGHVRFAGVLDDGALANAYGEAAVFALPVRTTVGSQAGGEGFGLVYLEAAAAGLPVVAGNGGAIPEVVRDGETGMLVDPQAPDEVARAIVRLLRDPELARRMGEAAQRRALEEFSFERFRRRLGELVAQVRGQA